jgi:hypothetical protein
LPDLAGAFFAGADGFFALFFAEAGAIKTAGADLRAFGFDFAFDEAFFNAAWDAAFFAIVFLVKVFPD